MSVARGGYMKVMKLKLELPADVEAPGTYSAYVSDADLEDEGHVLLKLGPRVRLRNCPELRRHGNQEL
jgi:hypothetical protein